MKTNKIFKNKPESMNYDTFRIKFLNARIGQMKAKKTGLYNKDGKYKDLPTKQHVVMIMNAYSPDKEGLKKKIKLLDKI